MEQVGVTEDGKKVLNGVFKFYDTCGLPLPDIFEKLTESNCMPCWQSFYKEAKEHGWKEKTIRTRLTEALIDSYGKDFCDVVIIRLFESEKKDET